MEELIPGPISAEGMEGIIRQIKKALLERALNAQLLTEKFQNTAQNDCHQTSAHAQEADLDCQTQLQRVGVSAASRRNFGRREREELLDFGIAQPPFERDINVMAAKFGLLG